MKNAIILHGMPSKEEYLNPGESLGRYDRHWLPWLQNQLIQNGINAQIPKLPKPYEPDYEKWLQVFEKLPTGKDTILVGHSCGGGFLVRWLSENKVKVGKVALVAPWINPDSSLVKPGFFNFKVDENLKEKTAGICLFISLDDDKEELDTAKMLKAKVKGIKVKEFKNRGHFTYADMGTEVFPELKDLLLN